MRTMLIPTIATLLLLSACNTTPERRLNETLPSQPQAPLASTTSSPRAPAATLAPAAPTASPSAVPAMATPSPTATPQPVASASPEGLLKQGSFRNGVHQVSGQALLIESAGKTYARLENFSTENGPDLYLYLVRNPSGSPRGESDFVSLGRLRGTSGNQNYELPAGTEISAIQAVTVWCRSFSVNFGFAELTAK
ncbi:MAG: DM13 domain-containing protein [Candidatus Sericytochromatia bacterium]